MSAVMKHTMVVRNPDTFEATALVAGEPVPDWATDLVDSENTQSEAAFKAAQKGESSDESSEDEASAPAAKKAAAKKS